MFDYDTLYHSEKKQKSLHHFGLPKHEDLHSHKYGGINKMGNIREEALEYEPPQFKNIVDIEKIPVNTEVFKDGEGTSKDGVKFTYDYIKVEGVEYRLPATVKEQLKQHLAEKPEIEFFKVKKTGEGMGTTYTVIPL